MNYAYDNIFIPIGLSIFFIATELYNFRSGPIVTVTPEMIPILWLQGFFTFILLPLSLAIDVSVHLGWVDIHLSSKYFDSTAWTLKFFTRAVYAILTVVAILRVIAYVIY